MTFELTCKKKIRVMTALEVEECGNEDIPIHVGDLFLLWHAVICMQLSKAVNEVYHMYNRHQFPFTVLNITTDRGTMHVF